MSWIRHTHAPQAPVRTRHSGCGRLALLVLGCVGLLVPMFAEAGVTNFVVRGVLKGVKPEDHQLVIAHEAIPRFMDAMTMPFNVKEATLLTNAVVGENITFQLHVTETESWVDHIKRAAGPATAPGSVPLVTKQESPSEAQPKAAAASRHPSPLRTFKFTNELGQPVCLEDFRGQAIALTFFFTRCPIPEFCPRLSRNFEEVQQKLSSLANAPTNWHLLSVTFDPANDTPAVLKAYGAGYHYDPAHWSFLTGPQGQIAELARACDVRYDPDNGLFNHNFRTLIIDTSNRVQMVFPTSGNLSDAIVQELLKAADGTNRSTTLATGYTRSGSGN